MSSRRSIVAIMAMSFALVGASACSQRGSKKAPAGAATGSGSTAADPGAGSGSLTAALEEAARAAAANAHPDGTLQLVGIDVLTTPPALFQQRAAGAGPRPMEPLVSTAKAIVHGVDAAKAGVLGDSVVVWIAVRPGKKTRAWVATPAKTGADTDAARAEIAGKVAMSPGPEVTGPVAFTVTFDRSGVRPASHDIPLPPELERLRGPAGDAPTPEELIDRAWKK